MKEVIYVDVSNDFYPEYLKQIVELLDKGNIVEPIVDCTGCTRNNAVQEIYHEALVNHYEDQLICDITGGIAIYSYQYELKK